MTGSTEKIVINANELGSHVFKFSKTDAAAPLTKEFTLTVEVIAYPIMLKTDWEPPEQIHMLY